LTSKAKVIKELKNDNNQVIIEKPNQVWSTNITYIKGSVNSLLENAKKS